MSDHAQPALEVRQLVKRYATFTAVDAVSFDVAAGSFFSILGPSGCGKTTLLRMIAGFIAPDSGDIRIAGQSVIGVPPNRRPVNMVFQHLALFPMMNVAENVGYGLRRRGVAREDIAKRVAAMLARVGLPDSGPKRIDQLSGGQKQRIAIARCLVLDPKVLVLDEPLGALDLKLRERMKVELKELQAAVGTTFVYITHDQGEALVMSDHIAVMNAGRFDQIGTPQELYYRPATAFVAGFVGEANRWRGRVSDARGGQARVALDGGPPVSAATPLTAGAAVEVFLRPEAVALARGGASGQAANRFPCRVESILFNGANSTATLRVEGMAAPLVAALPQSGALADLKTGESIVASWDAEACKCFPA
jgi:spermidine/putrescine transport system ATP-binding protein